MLTNFLTAITHNKLGVEIGGTSPTGNVIYENALSIDNVIFKNGQFWGPWETVGDKMLVENLTSYSIRTHVLRNEWRCQI